MSAVKVSVVIPAYNAERYISQTIDSVLAQTLQDWELIVVDDGSQDATCAIVESYCDKDPRITLLKSDRNEGVAVARNRGFQASQGDYVALLDSDDLWRMNKLEKQVELADLTGAEIVYCSYSIVDDQGNRVCDDFLVPDSIDFESLLVNRVISCSTAMLSSRVAKGYSFLANKPHEDYVYWLSILKAGHKACGIPEVLGSYRIHEGSRSSNKLKNAANLWSVYHGNFGLSFGKSVGLLFNYAFGGLKKYRRK